MEDVKLGFSDGALKSISEKAVARKTGARGLRSIMENILLDTMYELPGIDGVEEIVINREVVEDSGNPLYIYSKFNDEAETSA
jgi:ATP-dependent Clp protease ATP-binding subunit ClpX